MEKLKVLSLFSGIGAFEKALSNLNISHKVIGYSEIDQYTAKSYSLIHNVSIELNYGDIEKIDIKDIPSYDLLVGGSPCTNISKVGDKKGLEGNQSRLFYDYSRILNHTLPKYFVFENVDSLLSVNKGEDWKIVKSHLSQNYHIQYQILDAQDYGVPQSRKRLFVIGVRNDIDQEFTFPLPAGCNIKFEELLETEGLNEYNLSDKALLYMDRTVKGGRSHWDFKHHHDTQNTISSCLVANLFKGVPYNVIIDRRFDNIRYRHLTPLESLRLMGFDDSDYEKLKANNISKTRIYKMAGNSIVVNILEAIFKNLLQN